MQITFVSNYINHHQLPLCKALYELTNAEFCFIQTEPMEEERVKMGWDTSLVNYSFVKLFYDNPEECRRLIMESDTVLFGGAEDESLILPRLEAGKFTVRYSERIYKTGRWKFVSPRGLRQKYIDHIRFRKKNVYMLCAGAYVAGDFRLIGAYLKKLLKFGYFPEHKEYEDVHHIRNNKTECPCEILWAGRFIDWKHPEKMVQLAKGLRDRHSDVPSFHITMIGDGPLLEEIKQMVNIEGLENAFSFTGTQKPEEVREKMLESDIFISTSDRQEGWGAVVNEAMNSGCVTIAAKQIGAAPYLIRNGFNGYTYDSNSTKQLISLVDKACRQPEKNREIGKNAYKTITELWNAKVAAKRLYDFINDETKNMDRYSEGPLSRA